eukprot:g6908.t1
MAATAQDSSAPLRGASEKKEDTYEDDLEYSPFYGIEKGAVLQEARQFHQPQIEARKARQIITKLLYLVNQGESFTKKEASEVFFAVTKLFQHRDDELRRMVYLCIKDICRASDKVIIITSSLIKDMSSQNELYQANAIRVLCKIIDSTLLAQIERYLKQAIVDKSPVVSSAALVSGMHLLKENTDLVRRWNNEIHEVINSKQDMVQFHAVALQHALRANDRLAINKLVSGLIKGPSRINLSAMSQCLVIRFVSEVITEVQSDREGDVRPFYDFLEKCLRHKSEMVIFEAARAITKLKDFTTREITPAITVLQLFLSSSKPVLKFAAVRILNRVAMTHPLAVANCNIDMESLINDPNRSIATLAITTLLKTGNEGSVDRLLKQIGTFMSDISDDFKIVVEGGFDYKRAIVDSILILIREIPESKEAGLGHLCEFIEDCEFSYLSTQILHLLGSEGPKSSDPAKYIRFIYNRIILENATVRAAAVSSLAKFGSVDDLRSRVLILLKRALFDNDDEVCDRATLYVEQLSGSAGGIEAVVQKPERLPSKNLELALQEYLNGSTDAPFDISAVPEDAIEEDIAKSSAAAGPSGTIGGIPIMETHSISEYVEQLKSIPEFASFGALFKSCEPVQLTEEGTEYSVSMIKHIFDAHIVFQFNCMNTVAEQVLEEVKVVMDLAEAEDFDEEMIIPLTAMEFNKTGQCYTVMSRPPGSICSGKFATLLKFNLKEIDPATGEAEEGGFEDEYELEDIMISSADYVKPLRVSNFKMKWDELDPEAECVNDYGLGQRGGLSEAVEAVLETLGMYVCDGTDVIPPNARSHSVFVVGVFLGDAICLVRLSFGIDTKKNVAMKLVARGSTIDAAEAVDLIIQEG